MKLLTLNVGSKPFHDIAGDLVSGKGREVLFVNWIPTNDVGRDVVRYQIDIIENTPKDVQFVIFDRYSSLTSQEIEFFVNRKAILLEPVLKSRPGFDFMPYYIDRLDLPLSTWDDERPYHFGYKGNALSSKVESCLFRAIKNIPEIRIGVDSKKRLPAERYQSLKEVISFKELWWTDFNTTIIASNDDMCDRGVLPNITNHLKYGVVPLIHQDHKWFHALFKNFIMFDHHEVSWYKNMYKTLNYGFMDELYKNMELYLPEMLTENFVSKVISMVK
jgi:hypothetical protein